MTVTSSTPLYPTATAHAHRHRTDATHRSLPWAVVIFLIAVLSPVLFNLGPVAFSLLRLVLMVLIVPLTVQLLAGRFGRLYWTDALFLAHTAWMAPVFFVNNPSVAIQQIGSTGLEFWGGYLIGRAYIRTPESFVALCKFLVVALWCILPFALYESPTGRPILVETINRLPFLYSVTNNQIEGRMGLERVQAVFSHPIHYGLFCSSVFGLVLIALKGVIKTPWRYLHAAVAAGGTFMALSSAGLLALMIQVGLITWAFVLKRMKTRWWLLVGLMGAAYVTVDLLSNRTPVQVFMSYATFSPETAYWRGLTFEWGIKSVWTYPVFGIGLNDWVRPWFMFTNSVDNYWLLMAMRFGIPGFALVALGYLLMLFPIMRRDFGDNDELHRLRRAWAFNFVAITFVLCTVHIWTNIYSFTFFLFGAGVWMRSADHITKPPEPEDKGPSTPLKPTRSTPQFSRFPPK